MEYVNCNLCGSENQELVYSIVDALYFPEEWFNVVQCDSCGLGFVQPRPTYGEMGRFYPRQFYEYFDTESRFHARPYAVESRFLNDLTKDEDPKAPTGHRLRERRLSKAYEEAGLAGGGGGGLFKL